MGAYFAELALKSRKKMELWPYNKDKMENPKFKNGIIDSKKQIFPSPAYAKLILQQ